VLITLILQTLWQADQLVGIQHGIGQHLSVLSKEQIKISLKCFWLSELGYISTTTMLKLAIGALILRVSISRIDIILIRVIMVLNALLGIGFFFTALFQCNPISGFWDRSNPGHKCIDPNDIIYISYAHSALGIVSEWTMVALPIRMIWKSSLNHRSKIVSICVIGFGAIGSTATIIRIPVIQIVNNKFDFVYEIANLIIFSSIEAGVGLTAVNLVTLRPLFKSLSSRASSSSPTEVVTHTVSRSTKRIGVLDIESKPLNTYSELEEKSLTKS